MTIRITYPCVLYPLTPHFYIVKLGFTGTEEIEHLIPAQPVYDHQDYMSVFFISPYIPLLYSKNGVYRGLHYFLIFALKHILWVLVLTCSHNICFEQKYEKVNKFQLKIDIFTAVKIRCL